MIKENWEEVNPMDIPVWEPKENDEIIGNLKDIEKNVGPNKSMLYTMEKDNGDDIKVWGSTVLDKRMVAIDIGERVKIVYLGLVTSPETKREYKDFKVYHTKAKHKENSIDDTGTVYDGTPVSSEQ